MSWSKPNWEPVDQAEWSWKTRWVVNQKMEQTVESESKLEGITKPSWVRLNPVPWTFPVPAHGLMWENCQGSAVPDCSPLC